MALAFFFYVNGNYDIEDAPVANIDVIFSLNLDDFYTQENKRMDEEIKEVVYRALFNKMKGGLSEIITGVDYVNGLMNGYLTNTSAMKKDFNPYIVFSVTGSVTFTYQNC